MVDFGNDMKAAATDALKKCASELGIASDVYGTAEYAEEGVKVAYTPTPAPKATQIAKQGAIKTTGAATPPLKAPEVPAASDSPARAKLFSLAREYGAVAGKEQKLVESALKMKINWPKCTEKNLEMIYSQFLDKSSR